VASEAELIRAAVSRLQGEAPKVAGLKLVFGVELTRGGLTGPARSQRFRVELPGPEVSDGPGDDERVMVSIPGPMFALLAEEGQLADWREAYHFGHLKVSGDPRVIRLLGRAIGGV
jgi:hypothetical protein